MQCSRCGAPGQPGMAFCPNCGTPYASAQNAPGAAPIPSTQYEPTVAAPPYNPGQAFQPPASPTPSQPGYSDYNVQPANPYAPQAPNPYNAPGSYGTPPPPPDAFNAQNAYGAPPPPNAYGAPYTPPPGAFMPPNQPPPKKGPNVGLIIGIVVLLIVLVGGGVFAIKALSHPGGNSQTGTSTPGVTTTPGATTTTSASPTASTNQTPSPSGSPIDSASAGIISNVQTTSSIDSNYLPTHVTNQFSIGNVVYVTFHLNLTQSGYVQAKVYADNAYVTQSTLTVTVGKYDHGYFQITYNRASAGAFELYWCLQSDCSDGKLAAVAAFTVS